MIESDNVMLEHPQGRVEVGAMRDGRRELRAVMRDPNVFCPIAGCQTAYSTQLIRRILDIKGPAYLCDEIRRDEDPSYVQDRLQREMEFFFDLNERGGKRILDFGCGSGASTFCLARLIPGADIVGVELDPEFLSIAEARKRFYEERGGRHHTPGNGNVTKAVEDNRPTPCAMAPHSAAQSMWGGCPQPPCTTEVPESVIRIRFMACPSCTSLPRDIGQFDLIVLSAVYEHLLPEERVPVLGALWNALRPGGMLFINQTPNRWFPVEQHTTGLPLLNYLPDRLACLLARRLSSRNLGGDDWPTLLRKGIRGGSERAIMRQLQRGGAAGVEVLRPDRAGAEDGLDLWFRMSASRWHWIKRGLRRVFKGVAAMTGIQLVPAYIVMAFRKRP